MTIRDIVKGIAELAIFGATVALLLFFMVVMTMD